MEQLKEFEVITKIKVRWGDMDAMQHVNNIAYVAWGQVARIEYLEALGGFSPIPEKDAFGPILGFQSVKYIAPLFFPDTVLIGTKTDEIKEDRIIMKSFFYSQKMENLVAIKTHELIIFDFKTNKKIPVPNELIIKIKDLENQ